MHLHFLRAARRAGPGAVAGAALAACLVATPAPAHASGLTTLYSFTGGTDGAILYKGPARDTAGNLYGVSFYGADACPDSYQFANVGCGTVWKLDTSNTLTVLTTFLGAKNGADPDGNLTLKGKVLYGTTFTGGSANQGTVFRVTTSGTGFKLLHTFLGTDGAQPDSFPRFDASNNLFSVAQYGGPAFVTGQQKTGFGVLFEITAAGTFVSEHPFSGGTDGGQPGRMLLDANGTVVGGTAVGGSCSGTGVPAAGCGVLYTFVPNTGQFQVFYTFTGGSDGFNPNLGGFDGHGNLYGATTGGGKNGYGTLFEMKANGSGRYTYTHLYDFTGGADGAYPIAPFVERNGTLVGTTENGPITQSSQGAGILYSFSKKVLTPLYTFINDAHGGYPFGTPYVDATTGNIFGVTTYGGANNPCNTSGGTLISSFGCGTVFEYTP